MLFVSLDCFTVAQGPSLTRTESCFDDMESGMSPSNDLMGTPPSQQADTGKAAAHSKVVPTPKHFKGMRKMSKRDGLRSSLTRSSKVLKEGMELRKSQRHATARDVGE